MDKEEMEVVKLEDIMGEQEVIKKPNVVNVEPVEEEIQDSVKVDTFDEIRDLKYKEEEKMEIDTGEHDVKFDLRSLRSTEEEGPMRDIVMTSLLVAGAIMVEYTLTYFVIKFILMPPTAVQSLREITTLNLYAKLTSVGVVLITLLLATFFVPKGKKNN